MLQAFTDGAHRAGKVTWAYVLVEDGKEIDRATGQVTEPRAIASANVAGELASVMRAITKATTLGYTELEIVHDYTGPAEWASGAWRTTKWATIAYKTYLSKSTMALRFLKVAAHSGNKWNEEADRMAAEELRRAGVTLDLPKEEDKQLELPGI